MSLFLVFPTLEIWLSHTLYNTMPRGGCFQNLKCWQWSPIFENLDVHCKFPRKPCLSRALKHARVMLSHDKSMVFSEPKKLSAKQQKHETWKRTPGKEILIGNDHFQGSMSSMVPFGGTTWKSKRTRNVQHRVAMGHEYMTSSPPLLMAKIFQLLIGPDTVPAGAGGLDRMNYNQNAFGHWNKTLKTFTQQKGNTRQLHRPHDQSAAGWLS